MITIQTKIQDINSKDYPIVIGDGVLGELPTLINITKYSSIFVITDANVDRDVISNNKFQITKLKQATNQIYKYVIPAGEKYKNIETVKGIWSEMLKVGLDRKSLVIDLGGGVVGDLGGFAASTYMRGIDFVQIPTTVLAMVDASVGGKVGIDYNGVKNIVGSFNQPIAVIIDIDTLTTLPAREFIAGFAEIIKHGLVADKKYFELVTSKKPLEFTKEELVQIIKRSCEIKTSVIEQDEREGGMRKILNYGHTIGHAVEALGLTRTEGLLHGEAVAIGMVMENVVAVKNGILDAKVAEYIKEKIAASNLPTSVNFEIDQTKLLQLMNSDKKNIGGMIKWSLISEIGKCGWDLEARY